MKKITSTLIAVLVCSLSFAQGINFEKDNWANVKAKAVKEKKLIYLDIFTTWCGPCKMMARNYFPKKEAGDFYNKHFVNYQIDAEKGEGIEVAQKYHITGYPTNLFIEAATGKVVYRTMGMPGNIDGFVHNGEVALLEYKDPMKIDDYEKKLKTGKYDEPFLKKYLEKNNRLEKDNDGLIDIYLTKYSKSHTLDSNLMLVSKYQSGVDNEGFKLLTANKERLNTLKESPTYYQDMSQHWYLTSLTKDVEQKNEKGLNTHLARIDEFNLDDPKGTDFYYRKQYYETTNNQEKLKTLNTDYANYILNINEVDLQKQNEKQKEGTRKQIEWQAKQMGVTDEQLEGVVKENLERPEIKHQATMNYANTLNEIAWNIYEENSESMKNKNEVELATNWAEKGMQMVAEIESAWMPIADTYAHLLALQGQKDKAKEVQQKVVNKAKNSENEGLADYEAFLKTL